MKNSKRSYLAGRRGGVMFDIPKNKVLSVKRAGSKVVSIRRKYVSELNQICNLDSNYEYDYALFLDYLYSSGDIAGWIRNTTQFYFSEPVPISPKNKERTVKSHRPDFIIFNKDGTYEIHEVKGWMNMKATKVDEQFRKDYPDLTYKIIGRDEILALQAEFKDKLWGWEAIR